MTPKHITKDLILNEALFLIKEGGLSALSMRNLASRLDIKAPSLYVHIKNKADIIQLLQSSIFNSNQLLQLLNSDINSWQDLIFNIMVQMRNYFRQRPWLFELFSSFEPTSEASYVTLDTFILKMKNQGFKVVQAGYIARIMRKFLIGHMTYENTILLNSLVQPNPTSIGMNQELVYASEFINGLDEDSNDQIFEFGVQLIIKGCEKILNDN